MTHRVKYLSEMIDVGVSHVRADNPVSPFSLESLQNVLLRKLPQCLACCHTKQQIVFVVARYWRAMFGLFGKRSKMNNNFN